LPNQRLRIVGLLENNPETGIIGNENLSPILLGGAILEAENAGHLYAPF